MYAPFFNLQNKIMIDEINGFHIDVYNQHKLEEKTQGICPLCSHDRKPKNQKAKCASYDWDRGIGTCHNCNKPFQLHTFKRKGKAEKVYEKPKPFVESILSEAVVNWFEGRGISRQTLLDVKVTEGKEWMPQTQKEENTIKFNYFAGG